MKLIKHIQKIYKKYVIGLSEFLIRKSTSKTEIKFPREEMRYKRVEKLFEATTLLTLNKAWKQNCVNSSFVDHRSFRWFDPLFLIPELDFTTNNETMLNLNINFKELKRPLDYTFMGHDEDSPNSRFDYFHLTHLHKIVHHHYLRNCPANVYPVALSVHFVDAPSSNVQTATFLAYYQTHKDWKKRWYLQYQNRPKNLFFSSEIYGRKDRFDCIEGDQKISSLVQGSLAAQDNEYHNWHVDLGYGDLPKMRLPVNAKRLAKLFKLREIKDGDARRRALIHWVCGHKRKIQKAEGLKIIDVVRHMRGCMDFKWIGLNCLILPSELDLKKLHQPLSLKSKDVTSSVKVRLPSLLEQDKEKIEKELSKI